MGYAVVWVAEAYGSDAPTVLAWVAAHTERVDIGSAILQIPGRSPAMTAMTAATLDTLSGGRFRLGLGVSGPQVSEGWHGVRFDRPLARTREYVDIVRMALRREKVRYDGQTYRLPLPDGPGKALSLIVHPVRDRIPVYLAAVGPRNLELTGEIADGWLPVFFSPSQRAEALGRIRVGLERAGRSMEGFDVVPTMPLVVGEDWVSCADAVRGLCGLVCGWDGESGAEFLPRSGVPDGVRAGGGAVQDRYLAKDYAGAMAALPVEFLDATALLGPRERIAERMRVLADVGVTTLTVSPMAGEAGIGWLRCGWLWRRWMPLVWVGEVVS